MNNKPKIECLGEEVLPEGVFMKVGAGRNRFRTSIKRQKGDGTLVILADSAEEAAMSFVHWVRETHNPRTVSHMPSGDGYVIQAISMRGKVVRAWIHPENEKPPRGTKRDG